MRATDMLLPDFVNVGERRSGTTGLAAKLGRHRGIFMLQKRDRGYFIDDDARKGREFVVLRQNCASWEETHTLE
jgi:hypothetical protein